MTGSSRGKFSLKSEFTPEEWDRIHAHIRSRGMTFEVFLPEGQAQWLRTKLAAGVFKDAAEAAFVAFQDLRELDRHPEVRKQLLDAMIEKSLSDTRPGIPLEQWHAEHRAQLREWADSSPGKQRRYKTGRNQQINIKATPQVIERLHKLADSRQVPLGELLEQALDALEKSGQARQHSASCWNFSGGP